MRFVWVYWAGGAQGDELRFSMRSVVKHYAGNSSLSIVGDRPTWWRGHCVEIPRVRPGPYRSFRDSLNKLCQAVASPEIPDSFVWMMDDVYFVRHVRPSVLARHYYATEYSPADVATWQPRNAWQRLKKRSFEMLAADGLPIRDFATHLPQRVDKSRFRAMVDRYQPVGDRLALWEPLYCSAWARNPAPVPPGLFFRSTRPVDLATLQTQKAAIANNGVAAWNAEWEAWLTDRIDDLDVTTKAAAIATPLKTQRIDSRRISNP